jgi:hypothetical protein
MVAVVKVLWPPQGVLVTLLTVVVLLGCVGGIVFEIVKYRFAVFANVGTPLILFSVMSSAIIWMPTIAGIEGEAAEGASFLLILSGVPLILAATSYCAYRLIDVEPERSVTLKLD